MEKDHFTYKTHCEFAITSTEITPDTITKELDIAPGRSFKKGDQSISRHSGSVITKIHNLWALQSNPTESEEENITPHINYLKSTLLPKIDILKRYKTDARFEVSFLIWIETNDGGVGFDLRADEMDFLNSIANRVHFSFLINNNL